MDFNNQNGFNNDPYGNPNQDVIYDSNPQKSFSEPTPDHLPGDIQAAKNSLSCGIFALLGGIFTNICIWSLQHSASIISTPFLLHSVLNMLATSAFIFP